jgi:hypothetical protein
MHTITHVQKKAGDSHLWSGLMKVKESFLSLGHMKLNNGKNIVSGKIDGWGISPFNISIHRYM